jgi:ATP-binding cassette subfamily F protein 3
MIKLRLDKISFSYPSSPIFRGISCEIQEGCYGVIGPNGSGKTTLLKLILDELKPDSGIIARDKNLHVVYMPQEVQLDPELSAYETVYHGATRVQAIEKQLTQLEAKFSDPFYFSNTSRLARLIDQQELLLSTYNRVGGPGLDGQIKNLLATMGFDAHEQSLPVKHLSGGQKKLLSLAEIMIDRPDILLLDEPDNHLDLAGKNILQNLIIDFPGTVLIVSHDRYFLDMVVEQIIEVENGKITQFTGNYSEYMFEKRLTLQRQSVLYKAQQKEIIRLEQAAKRLLMWGKVYDNPKFISRGKNILNRIDRMDKVEKPTLEKDKIEIQLGGWRGSEKVLEINHLNKGFNTADGSAFFPVLKEINLLLRNGNRAGVIGPNGSGKSLLVQIILGKIQPDSGEITIGPRIKLGYYAQEFEILDPKQKLLETVCKAGNFSENKGVAFLKKFLFTYEQRDSLVGTLSGGERARLQIALITLSDANFLILDEPTNHLDIPSCEVLEDALLEFNGTILTISHDRYFLDRLVDRIIEMDGGYCNEYFGNYSDYEKQRQKSIP